MRHIFYSGGVILPYYEDRGIHNSYDYYVASMFKCSLIITCLYLCGNIDILVIECHYLDI